MEEEKKKRITEWISGHKRILIAAAAAAAVILVIFLAGVLRTYTSYETASSFEHAREGNDQYILFGGRIVQYGGDGITCLDSDGESLWSKSFEMEQPTAAQTDHYLALADQGGSTIYVFDTDGFVQSVQTPYPVRALTVSDSGTVGAMLEDGETCRVILYDIDGNVIVEGRSHLDDNGYPAALALSDDGTVMAVSYLTVSAGEIATELKFYDFSGTESGTPQASAEYTYSGEAIVRIALINGKFITFSDAAVRIYTGTAAPSLRKEILMDAEACSIVIGTGRFALVYEADEETADAYRSDESYTKISADATADAQDVSTGTQKVYEIDVYGASGGKKTHALFSGDYQSIVLLSNGAAAVLGTDTLKIISGLGITRLDYTFDETICGVFSGKFSGYTFIFTDRIEKVNLR